MSFKFNFVVKCDQGACPRSLNIIAANPHEANEKLEKEGWIIGEETDDNNIRHTCPNHGKPLPRA